MGWQPDPCDHEGGHPLDRQGRVEALAKQWRTSIWEPNADAVNNLDFVDFKDEELSVPTVLEVKAVAKSFPSTLLKAWMPGTLAYSPCFLTQACRRGTTS